MPGYTLYYAVSLPDAYVIEWQGRWYTIPAVQDGWAERAPYQGSAASLKPVEPVAAYAPLVATLGIPTTGGPRKGAGAPTVYDEPMTATTVRLTADQTAHLRSIGDGNVSTGVRRLVERDRKDHSPAH